MLGLDPYPLVSGLDPYPMVSGVDPYPLVSGLDPYPLVSGGSVSPEVWCWTGKCTWKEPIKSLYSYLFYILILPLRGAHGRRGNQGRIIKHGLNIKFFILQNKLFKYDKSPSLVVRYIWKKKYVCIFFYQDISVWWQHFRPNNIFFFFSYYYYYDTNMHTDNNNNQFYNLLLCAAFL